MGKITRNVILFGVSVIAFAIVFELTLPFFSIGAVIGLLTGPAVFPITAVMVVLTAVVVALDQRSGESDTF